MKDVLDVLIKIYRPNSNLLFPNGGKLTPYLEKLNIGDKIHMEGPFGKFGYEAGGNVILGIRYMIQMGRSITSNASSSWPEEAESLLATKSSGKSKK